MCMQQAPAPWTVERCVALTRALHRYRILELQVKEVLPTPIPIEVQQNCFCQQMYLHFAVVDATLCLQASSQMNLHCMLCGHLSRLLASPCGTDFAQIFRLRPVTVAAGYVTWLYTRAAVPCALKTSGMAQSPWRRAP